MTTWKWCACRACGFDGELMQFVKSEGLACPKCGSGDAEPEDEAHFETRAREDAAKYISVALQQASEGEKKT